MEVIIDSCHTLYCWSKKRQMLWLDRKKNVEKLVGYGMYVKVFIPFFAFTSHTDRDNKTLEKPQKWLEMSNKIETDSERWELNQSDVISPGNNLKRKKNRKEEIWPIKSVWQIINCVGFCLGFFCHFFPETPNKFNFRLGVLS